MAGVKILVRQQEGSPLTCYNCGGEDPRNPERKRPVTMVVHHTYRYWNKPSRDYDGPKYDKVCTERFLCTHCYDAYKNNESHWSQGRALFTSKPRSAWNSDKWPVFEGGEALDEDKPEKPLEEEEEEENDNPDGPINPEYEEELDSVEKPPDWGGLGSYMKKKEPNPE